MLRVQKGSGECFPHNAWHAAYVKSVRVNSRCTESPGVLGSMCLCIIQLYQFSELFRSRTIAVSLSVIDLTFPPCSCRYRSGIRGHMKAVVMDLLRQYLKVETQFQHGKSLTHEDLNSGRSTAPLVSSTKSIFQMRLALHDFLWQSLTAFIWDAT